MKSYWEEQKCFEFPICMIESYLLIFGVKSRGATRSQIRTSNPSVWFAMLFNPCSIDWFLESNLMNLYLPVNRFQVNNPATYFSTYTLPLFLRDIYSPRYIQGNIHSRQTAWRSSLNLKIICGIYFYIYFYKSLYIPVHFMYRAEFQLAEQAVLTIWGKTGRYAK